AASGARPGLHRAADNAVSALLQPAARRPPRRRRAPSSLSHRRAARRRSRIHLPQVVGRFYLALFRELLALAARRLRADRNAPAARRAVRRMQRQADARQDALISLGKCYAGARVTSASAGGAAASSSLPTAASVIPGFIACNTPSAAAGRLSPIPYSCPSALRILSAITPSPGVSSSAATTVSPRSTTGAWPKAQVTSGGQGSILLMLGVSSRFCFKVVGSGARVFIESF